MRRAGAECDARGSSGGSARARGDGSGVARVALCALALVAVHCQPGANEERAAPQATRTHPLREAVAPLPSWRETPTKRAIVGFVAQVTEQGGGGFVPPAERVAVFDNDGTLWTEQPAYVQLAFAFDRVKELAPSHAEWRSRQPFKSILEGDFEAALASGERGIAELVAATHLGNTTEEFEGIVTRWIGSARHPRFERLHTELVYQPMLELIAYLHANEFDVFIVSGGGVEFMRPWVERTYGVPRSNVVGSRARMRYEKRDGEPVLVRLPEVDLVDDKAGKPLGIQQLIGRRPLAAFGNSDGDFEMLEWTTSGSGPRLGVLVHHTDAEREFAYDRDSHAGRLARALDEAPQRSWVVVDMKRDWARVYPFER